MSVIMKSVVALFLTATLSTIALAQPSASAGAMVKNCSISGSGVMNVANPVEVRGSVIKFNDLAGSSSPHWDGKNAYDKRSYDGKTVFCLNGRSTTAKKVKGTCKLNMTSEGGTIKKLICVG